jgi:cytochrome c-type biogenesis protein CcmH/NrfF
MSNLHEFGAGSNWLRHSCLPALGNDGGSHVLRSATGDCTLAAPSSVSRTGGLRAPQPGFHSIMRKNRNRCISLETNNRCQFCSKMKRGGIGRQIALALSLFFVVLAPLARADNTDRAKALSKKVMCMCGGCNDTAGTCNHTGGAFSGPCDTAKAMQKEVAERVNRGDSDDLILQSFVQEYGPTVLPDPPKKGFTWLVWIAPIVAPLIALYLIWEVVRRWRRRQILAPAGGPPISADLLDRARREADRETHE